MTMRQHTLPPVAARTSDSAAEFRTGFVSALALLNMTPSDCADLVERLTGLPFELCRPAELEPVLDQLTMLLRKHALGGEAVRAARQ